MEALTGIDIIENTHLTVTIEVKRGWRERLFSRPWHPGRAWRLVQVPDPAYYIIDSKTLLPEMPYLFEPRKVIVAHPQTVETLRHTMNDTS